jgi:GT2 family glycosyltransferase
MLHVMPPQPDVDTPAFVPDAASTIAMPKGVNAPGGLPALSIVVCTRNRVAQLKRCVEAVLAVTTAHDWELVLVDNASTDGTWDYLASLADQRGLPASITTVVEPIPGLAAARNRGWRAARGGIVAFTDDDCYIAPDFVDSMVQVFVDHPEIGFAGGRILLFDDRDCRITIQESPRPVRFPPRTFLAAGEVQGANMAFTRAALEQVGGFDERLGAGTPFPCEDIDAVAAVLWAGVPGVYHPKPVVYHHHGRRMPDEVESLMRSYDAGRGAYLAKYLLRADSRMTYLRASLGSLRRDCTGAVRRGRLPRRSLRELTSGLRFALRG